MRKFQLSLLFTLTAFNINAETPVSTTDVGQPSVRSTNQESVAKCPFSLGNICFYPAVGAMYGNKSGGEKYKDLRFAAVLHGQIKGKNRHSFGAMIAPGENFIDAAGFGGAYGFIEYASNKYAVLNYGVMAKRHKYEGREDEIRGGVYLLLSTSF